jgi:ESX secretion system protein EccC
LSRILFHRPARVLPPTLPSEPVVLAAPPQPAGRDSNATWVMLLMPLLSSISMAAYMIVDGKKILILLGICFVLVSIGATVGVRMQIRSGQRRARLRARDRYLEHLVAVRTAARRVAADQRAVAAWAQPSPRRLWAIARRRHRLWERRAADPDFLRVRIGTGRGPLTTPIRLASRNDPTVEYDARAKAAAERLIASCGTVGAQPAVVDLARAGVVTVVGPAAARDLARALVCQVAVLHAPDDVAIAVVTGGEDWAWAKWLPHAHEPQHAAASPDAADAQLAPVGIDLDTLALGRADTGAVATAERLGTAAAAGIVPLVAEDFEGLADVFQQRLADAAQRAATRRGAALSLGGRPHPGEQPQRLLVVLDRYEPRSAWARTPVAAELLASAGPQSGITVVCVVEREHDEPTRSDVRVRVEADGSLLLEPRRPEYVEPVADAVADRAAPELSEEIARRLAPLRLSAEGEEVLARTMSLADMLGVDDLANFDPTALRVAADADDVLRLPLGFDAEGRTVHLDLKESARGGMGPHGLVVGATGAGKSELLRTLVTGLTTRHSPELLSLVLVDFKGGATFAGVTELPHVAGLITNLVDDLALVDRVRDALVGEQQRRQRILRDAGNVDSVRDYQLRRAAGQTAPDGKPLEPLPYLLVIVDEFGELLSRRPDFIELFVQIGRVGRSLGMHLLLATQRLEEGRLRGLEANLSYRICLRTFTAAESRTVIGTPDAYRLPPIPGSAYLKVGEEVYERFRVAHASGPYETESAAERAGAAQAAARLAARPVLFGLRTPREAAVERPGVAGAGTQPRIAQRRSPEPIRQTEMQVMVANLCRYGQAAHQVWLPPLPAALPLDALTGPVAAVPGRGLVAQWWPQQGLLRFPVGVTDLPSRQLQQPLVPDFAGEHGHLAVIGSPQSGKSTFLRTLMLSAMVTHTPDEVQFAAIDYGGGALLPFERSPHVSGVAGRHDPQRVRRVLAEAAQLIAARERLMRELGLDSAAEFRRARAEGRLPAAARTADVFLLVDNWGAVRGELEGADAVLLDLAGRGLGVAVHLVLTANRWADLRTALRDAISGRLELRLNDPAESEINRRLARQYGAAVPGRGMAPPGVQYHVALPRLDGVDSLDGLAAAQQDALTKIADGWDGPVAPSVRVLPERVLVSELPEAAAATSHGAAPAPRGVPIGLAESDLGTVVLDLEDQDAHFLVLGDSGSGKSAFLRAWLAGLTARRSAQDVRVVLVDYRRSLLGAVPKEHLGAYAGDVNAARVYVEQVVAKLHERLAPPHVTAEQLRDRSWWQGPELYLVIDDFDLVSSARPSPLAPLVDLLPQAREIGLHVVLARRVSGLLRAQGGEPLLHRIRELGAPGLVLSGDPREGVVLGDERAEARPPGRGVLVRRNGRPELVQLALADAAAVAS